MRLNFFSMCNGSNLNLNLNLSTVAAILRFYCSLWIVLMQMIIPGCCIQTQDNVI